MHRQRILSAFILIPPALLLIQFGGLLPLTLVVDLIVAIGLWEFCRMLVPGADWRVAAPAIAAGWLAVALVAQPSQVALPVAVIVVGVGAASLLRERGALPDALRLAGLLLLGIAYVAGLGGFLVALRQLPNGRGLLFYLLAVVWVGDSAAFYGGRALGRRRLAPTISPGKTMEGSLAGLLGGAVVSLIVRSWFVPGMGTATALVAGGVLSLAGQLGDLWESHLKRRAGVKDSGALIPGHGGVLDRMDSLMLAGPVLYGLARGGWL